MHVWWKVMTLIIKSLYQILIFLKLNMSMHLLSLNVHRTKLISIVLIFRRTEIPSVKENVLLQWMLLSTEEDKYLTCRSFMLDQAL